MQELRCANCGELLGRVTEYVKFGPAVTLSLRWHPLDGRWQRGSRLRKVRLNRRMPTPADASPRGWERFYEDEDEGRWLYRISPPVPIQCNACHDVRNYPTSIT